MRRTRRRWEGKDSGTVCSSRGDLAKMIMSHAEECQGEGPLVRPRHKWLNESLTPWSVARVENLLVSQLVEKLYSVYETRRFITAFTTALQLFLSWASARPPPIVLKYILKSCHLCVGLPRRFFPPGSPTETLYAFSLAYMERRIASTLFNKQSATTEKVWYSSLGVGRGATTRHKISNVRNVTQGRA